MTAKEWNGEERRSMPERCDYHQKRLESIEERQLRIYQSMFGENGDPRKGYAWKIEKIYDWFYEIEEPAKDALKWAAGIKKYAGLILVVALTGACAAIWTVFVEAVKRGVIK
jgi:hypothetical protein